MIRGFIKSVAILALLASAFAHPASAAPKKNFKLAWTIYVGWMPWPWAAEHGIVKKWADKYGITIDVVQVNDYAESINQYTAGAFDALTITNMDTLAVPAVGGIDSTSIIMGDFSNGNDAVILKDKTTLADIKGLPVNLVQYSVSQYLLDRAIASIKLTERDIRVINTSDSDMAAAYQTPDVKAVVTWNPIVQELLKVPSAHKVFDSSQIPGEIMDLVIVNTATLKENPAFAQALVGIWYETTKAMAGDGAEAKAARSEMAKASGTDLPGFDDQLRTTKLFSDAKDAVAFTDSDALPKTMALVRDFLFDHQLLGDNAKSPDVIGVEFPGGEVLGSKTNVKFRFDDSFMKMARDGKL
jgi:NitT/TauT family transport system substrate-binding protein